MLINMLTQSYALHEVRAYVAPLVLVAAQAFVELLAYLMSSLKMEDQLLTESCMVRRGWAKNRMRTNLGGATCKRNGWLKFRT